MVGAGEIQAPFAWTLSHHHQKGKKSNYLLGYSKVKGHNNAVHLGSAFV